MSQPRRTLIVELWITTDSPIATVTSELERALSYRFTDWGIDTITTEDNRTPATGRIVNTVPTITVKGEPVNLAQRILDAMRRDGLA